MDGFSEEGHVIVTVEHDVMVTLPVRVKQCREDVEVRARLFEVVQERFPLIDAPTLEAYRTKCRFGNLAIIEDDEHGHQIGVVLKKVVTHEPVDR